MDTRVLAERLQRLEDAEAIRSLKSRYFTSCDAKNPAAMRACFADGPVAIDFGMIGRFDNADALVAVYTQMACHPHMVERHHGSNPQIEVIDATRARGTWSLAYELIDTQNQKLTQLAGHYEDEYRRTADGWRMSATKFVATSTLSFDLAEGLTKVLFAGNPAMAGVAT
ncbi:nuclear transport factor 2 family protein [Polycyclovorans algicola]|uniref:nuclear transport factor 2 family protein n=1 Tax=Polycyclovorans algicola TaxID=616992 RepID=UPI0004A720BD|nr:nuclear transport factor 2 family protein [Polycyclovorans algicola]